MSERAASRVTIRVGALTSFRGPQGPKGDKGDPGYSPVRGVDYWTAADRAPVEEATRSANAAAGRANASAQSADAAAERANAAADRASDAASAADASKTAADAAEAKRAEAEAARVTEHNANRTESIEQTARARAVADRLSDVDMTVTMLPPSGEPTAEVVQTATQTAFHLGIPMSNLAYATFEVDSSMDLLMHSPDGFDDISFQLNNGDLEVSI